MALPLSTLHRIRGSVKASLTRLDRTLHNPDTVFSLDNLPSYEELLKECQKKFDEVQRNIYHHPEVETDEDFEKESLEQADFDDRVVIVQTKIKHIYRVVLRTDKSASNDTYTAQSTQEQSQLCQEQFKLTQKMVEALDNFKPSIQQVKLPPIDIPKFSGKYNEWTSFRDMFSSSIHNNQNLPEVEKCKYLMGYLIGEAKSLVSHLSITEQNYKIAWDIIKDRFEKKQNIVTSHIPTFFNQPAIAGEASAKSLR
ncbi:uncharacterized protein LOC129808962 [Phlebotomus papatasi]|uniref:uncharacterized protein LOC129808962 n=1 Tax=Phlebotomus papatasi TaxID=29031 RepID=UPI0024846BA0|nr:uncharacterized protein LOC129808962 [Phlebotomus papatasi]